MGRRFIPSLLEEAGGKFSEDSGMVKIVGPPEEDWPEAWPSSPEEYEEYLMKGTCRGTPIRVNNFVPDV